MIALLSTSAFVVILNETIMGVALPNLMISLEISAATAQWLTTGFLLTMAIVIPLTGFLMARFTLRTLFFSAMTLFAVGTLIAALAPGFAVLLIGRVVQASGTAIMMPLLTNTVLNTVPKHKRGRMMGVITIVIAVAPAIGPTVSGLILSVLDWRWLFIVMLPIAIVALALGAVWIRNLTETRPTSLDIVSVALSAFGFGGLIFGFSLIGESASGHAPLPAWLPICIGAIAVTLFIIRQIRLQSRDAALLDLRTFTTRPFTVAVILVAVVMSALFGSLIMLPMYLQQVMSLDTLTVGLMLLPGGVLMGIMGPIVGTLFDKFGPKPLVTPGMIVVALSLGGMATFGTETPIGFIVATHMTMNLGLGFVMSPLLTSALGELPRKLYADGSATVSTVQQLAGAAGTALFVTLMSLGSASAAQAGAGQVQATAAGVHNAFLVGACVAATAVVLTFFVRRPSPDDMGREAITVH